MNRFHVVSQKHVRQMDTICNNMLQKSDRTRDILDITNHQFAATEL